MSDPLAAVRLYNERARSWVVVLDDDPTGCQSVHDVTVLVDPSTADLVEEAAARRTTFVWTNARSMDEASAIEVNHAVAAAALEAARAARVVPSFVSRSDSTLRGHFAAELATISAACRQAGRPVDGIVFVPAFLEAGRTTADDVQWVSRPDGSTVPAASTEFARDATFGYSEQNLRDWVAARTGALHDSITSISIDDLRRDTTSAAEAVLAAQRGGVVVGNAVDAHDLDTLALACRRVEQAGHHLVYRTGPSFVRSLTGQPPRSSLTKESICRGSVRDGAGLVVVGSHTTVTTRQLESARRRHPMTIVELDVVAATDEGCRHRAARETADALTRALRAGDAALVTSRAVRVGDDRRASLALARQVSAQVCEVIRRLPPDLPLRHVVAKGGITSHEVATAGLGMRKASVLGQLFPGSVSVLRLGPETTRPGIPYVVFPGNVGGDETLAEALAALA